MRKSLSFFFPVLTRPLLLVCILILSGVAFGVFVPVVPVARPDCQTQVHPGCGGPEYDSVTYYTLGAGGRTAFVVPDTPYGWIAAVVSILFYTAIGYALVLVCKRRSRPSLD